MTLSDEINEMIKFAMLNMKITSAAGTSPLINRVIDIDNLQERDLEAFLSADARGLFELLHSLRKLAARLVDDAQDSQASRKNILIAAAFY